MALDGPHLKSRLLCGAAGVAMLAVASPAMAQDVDNDDAPADQIVVTGIRSSIQNSLSAKKNADGIVEAISAEDVGKLPDLSIADALARLPGVTAQRVRGRSQQISIRGLGPDFSLALLNGREVVSAGNNRGIEFDQFPSELIAQGIVYKTPNATLAATGIAGAVDLRTIKPLSFKDRKLNLSARYVVNDNGELNPDFSNQGYRFFGSYIDQNADGTIGWSIGATHQSNPTQFFSRELKTDTGQVSRDVNGLIYPSDNPRQGVVSREFERTSVAGALQFEPNDRFQASLDAFYTDTRDSGIFRGTETPLASWTAVDDLGDPGAQFVGATGSGPFADSATYSGVVPILRTDTEGNTAEIFAIGGNASYDVSDRLRLMVDYGFSTLDRSDIDYESYAGTGPTRTGPQDTLTFGFPSDGQYTIDGVLDYTDPSLVLLTDPGGWGQVGFIKEPQIDDELHQLRAEADYEVDAGPIAAIKLGYLYTEREKNFDSNESFIRASSQFSIDPLAASIMRPAQFLAIPAGSIVGATNTGSIGMDIIAYDPSSFLTDGTYALEKATFDTEWSVQEQIHTAYFMADILADLGSVPVRGNVGVQYVNTDQSSVGTIDGTDALNNVRETYDHWLPSVNLAFEIMPDTFLKLAFAQTLTRARLDQLAANQSVNTNPLSCGDSNGDQIPDTLFAFDPPSVTCFSLDGGNPSLRPYESTSYDVSFEKYFSPSSALAVAFFHKDLSDWVVDFSALVDGSQQIRTFGAGDFLDANPQVAASIVNGPVNLSEGSITGVEATLRVDLVDVVESLDGFGFSFSYTYADASVDGPNGEPEDIPGYSENIWSGDIYYEKNGIQAKLSARHRGEFLSEIQNFDGSLSGSQAENETILDGQIGYSFDGRGDFLDGLGIQFEVFNITDEPFVTENDLEDPSGNVIGTFPSRHELYGRTYNITIKKEF
jgi:iron complex outermembrane receptor protein